MPILRLIASLLIVCPLTSHAAPPDVGATAKRVGVHRWGRAEIVRESARPEATPGRTFEAVVVSPSGHRRVIPGFWDGARRWKVRFRPDEVGTWSYETRSDDGDPGLASKGTIACAPYAGKNPLYRHGALRVAASGSSFEHADGTPHLWLADTAWTGPFKADLASWRAYLRKRRAQGFGIVQIMSTQTLAMAGNADGRTAYTGLPTITMDPVFFQHLDERIDAANEEGLIVAPVIVWAAHWNQQNLHMNPGTSLTDGEIARLARYVFARYDAHHVVWMLAGDADYRGAAAERWKRVGRALFAQGHGNLATMHPSGRTWIAREFGDEPWFSFHAYQSGHRDVDSMRWILEGPHTTYAPPRRKPIVNVEPLYEGHENLSRPGNPFTAHDLRRATFSSLLTTPVAGVSYGAHGVWSWETRPAVPMNHPGTGLARPWNEALDLPGAAVFGQIARLARCVPWWRLEPARALAPEAGGGPLPSRPVVAATKERDLVLAYLPEGGSIALPAPSPGPGGAASWIRATDGRRIRARPTPRDGRHVFDAPTGPGGPDWLLVVTAGPPPACLR